MDTLFRDKDLRSIGKKVKKKKVKISGLKERVWAIASRVFRKLDAIDRGNGDYVKCATCSKTDLWTNFEGGHFCPGKHNSAKFLKENVHCQCHYCNCHLHSNGVEYTLFMQKHYGMKRTEEIWALKHIEKKFTEDELRALMADFKRQAEELHIS